MFNQNEANNQAFNQSVEISNPIDQDTFDKAHYVWMRSDPLALQIMNLSRYLIERFRTAGLRLIRNAFPTLCESNVITIHGAARLIDPHPSESPGEYRARVIDARAWHGLRGREMGIHEALMIMGLSGEGIHAFPSQRKLWGAETITAVDLVEAGCEDLAWLVRTEDDTGALTHYKWNGSAWASTTESDVDNGNTAEELEDLSEDDWSSLLPCGEIAFVTRLIGDNWLKHKGIGVYVEAEFLE